MLQLKLILLYQMSSWSLYEYISEIKYSNPQVGTVSSSLKSWGMQSGLETRTLAHTYTNFLFLIRFLGHQILSDYALVGPLSIWKVVSNF